MILAVYTFVHVLISVVGIGAGIAVVCAWLQGKRLAGWEPLFLWTTVATSVTGFFFPFHGFKPSYAVGILSLIVLAFAFMARDKYRLAGGWRTTYIGSAVVALYFNVFVLIVQLFLKVPALHALAPTQTETPFKAAQLAALAAFLVIGITAARKFPRLPA